MERNKNKGFTLVELIVVIAIIGILAAVLVPQYIQYIEKAKEAKVVQEIQTIERAATVALTEYAVENGAVGKTTFNYNGTPCYRLSNYWLSSKLSTLKGNPDYELAKLFIDSLGFKNSADGTSSIPFGNTQPGSDNKWNGSMNEKALFQVIYTRDSEGFKILASEYSRNGYFVRLKDGEATVTKLSSANQTCFTDID